MTPGGSASLPRKTERPPDGWDWRKGKESQLQAGLLAEQAGAAFCWMRLGRRDVEIKPFSERFSGNRSVVYSAWFKSTWDE